MPDKTMFYCPHCNVRISVAAHSGDYVHECNSGQAVLDNEDVPNIGVASEFSQTITQAQSSQDVMRQGIANKFQGTRAGIEGERLGKLTVRGNRTSTNRTRQYFRYIE